MPGCRAITELETAGFLGCSALAEVLYQGLICGHMCRLDRVDMVMILLHSPIISYTGSELIRPYSGLLPQLTYMHVSYKSGP
jgi:hypothetical protein